MPAPRAVNCPRCNAPVPWGPQSRYRPFCSERCKLIDLGAWASEEYKVSRSARHNDDPDVPENDAR